MLNGRWCGRYGVPDANASKSRFASRRESGSPEAVQFLARTPVLPGTVFGLELLLQEGRIDIGAATELVLNDVGAVIQILSRAARAENRTALQEERISECLVILDLSDLLISLHRCAIAPGSNQLAAVWEHCRLVARYASMIAESKGEIPAEDAYLAGLLDDRGAIAAVLGWPRNRKPPGAGELLCAGEMLPRNIRSAFCPVPAIQRPRKWKYILETAGQLAGPPRVRASAGIRLRGQ